MTDRVWHKGPPPHVGWWNASRSGNTSVWRWWDGRRWSMEVWDDESGRRAKKLAKVEAPEQFTIEWSDYWPENARVPRIDPRTLTKESAHA